MRCAFFGLGRWYIGALAALAINSLSGAGPDFNGDGFDDLAAGCPHESVGTIDQAGSVHIIYGSGGGLKSAGDQVWTQDSTGVPGSAGAAELFGHALAWGDFDGDGFDDLAISVPGESVSGFDDAGSVHVLYGSSSGLTASGDQLWHQDSANINDQAEMQDNFGMALAAGDFDGDGRDDLAIGTPFESVAGLNQAGAVNVLYGSSSGLKAAGDQLWHQDQPGMRNEAEFGDRFGQEMVAGDFDGDGRDDLAIGVPGQDVSGQNAAGAVHILYGSSSGLRANDDQVWHQDQSGVTDPAEAGDMFGDALAAGDFDGDGRDDLAIGVGSEDIGALANAGAVNVLYGSASGLRTAGDQFWHQDRSGITDSAEAIDFFGGELAAGDFDGDGRDDLAIAAAGEDVSGSLNAGAVHILYGASSGLRSAGEQYWHQDKPGIHNSPDDGDLFGASLASADFDGDGRDDLAIGVSDEGIPFPPGTEITDVNVEFFGFSHTFPSDVDVMLVAPTGANAIIMSDAGSGFDVSGLFLTFDDEAGASLPDSNILTDGTFLPTNHGGGDTFAAPAPAPAGGSALSAFDGIDLTGTWSLYIVDDEAPDGGSISLDWFLHIETNSAGSLIFSNADGITIPASGAASPYPSTIDVSQVPQAGAIHVLYGRSSGLDQAGAQFWHENSSGINGTAEAFDSFGSVLR